MSQLLSTLRLTLATLVVCAVLYPAVLLALGAAVFPASAAGSLVERDGEVLGSRLIGQSFASPRYFWGRPSAVGYDASATGGSNFSPTSPVLTERAREILGRLDTSPSTPVPADLLAASGSGVDPHISRAAALVQVPRVAAARGLEETQVRDLVAAAGDDSGLRIFGEEPVVNVLLLNLALDAAVSQPERR